MIVELLDYRPQQIREPPPISPLKTRVALFPNAETLWADLCSLSKQQGSKWTDTDALEAEAKILVSMSIWTTLRSTHDPLSSLQPLSRCASTLILI